MVNTLENLHCEEIGKELVHFPAGRKLSRAS